MHVPKQRSTSVLYILLLFVVDVVTNVCFVLMCGFVIMML